MNRIREVRLSAKLTMKQLGAMIGVSESTISLYETGKRQPDNETTIRIADALGVSLDYLFGRTIEKPAVKDGELDEKLVNLLLDLSPDEAQRVADFVAGLKASRTK